MFSLLKSGLLESFWSNLFFSCVSSEILSGKMSATADPEGPPSPGSLGSLGSGFSLFLVSFYTGVLGGLATIGSDITGPGIPEDIAPILLEPSPKLSWVPGVSILSFL